MMNWLNKLLGKRPPEPKLEGPSYEEQIAAMRRLEDSLTPEQKAWAFAYARSLGWTSSTTPPMWVWSQIFYEAKRAIPVPQPTVH